MRKIKLYIAMSLNGKIADTNGSVDWLESLPKTENSDYGYAKFYKSIDTTLEGRSTYDQILSWGIDFPYADKKNYVITREQGIENTDHVEFITDDHISFIKDLKRQEGKDIWLVGGGSVNTMLINEELIDEMIVFVMPIILSDGIDLFEGAPDENQLELVDSKSYSTGAVELKYVLNR